MKIMNGEESMASERKKEGGTVGHKRKKRSHLRDEKYKKRYAKGKLMASAPSNSERDEEAKAIEEDENHSAQI